MVNGDAKLAEGTPLICAQWPHLPLWHFLDVGCWDMMSSVSGLMVCFGILDLTQYSCYVGFLNDLGKGCTVHCRCRVVRKKLHVDGRARAFVAVLPRFQVLQLGDCLVAETCECLNVQASPCVCSQHSLANLTRCRFGYRAVQSCQFPAVEGSPLCLFSNS